MGADVTPPPELADFVAFLDKERNDSPHTVKAYARDVADFAAFCTQYYGGAAWSFAGVDRLAIRGWLGALQQRGLGKRSAARAPARAHASRASGPRGGRAAVHRGRAAGAGGRFHRGAGLGDARAVLLDG